MVQKTYFKTKDYCKVKFNVVFDQAETVEILGLNSDWEKGIIMSKKKDGTFSCDVQLPKNSTHEFLYRVNQSNWTAEEEVDGNVPNPYGGTNSLLVL